MLNAVAALALWAGLPHLQLPHAPFLERRTETFHASSWVIKVRPDAFTGRTACTIRGHDTRYENGVFTFGFRGSTDSANAVFRVDGGPVQTAQSVAIQAAGLGAPFNSGDSRNPSGGRVYIPETALSGAQAVAIRPNPKSGPRTFPLIGFAEAKALAVSKGCKMAD